MNIFKPDDVSSTSGADSVTSTFDSNGFNSFGASYVINESFGVVSSSSLYNVVDTTEAISSMNTSETGGVISSSETPEADIINVSKEAEFIIHTDAGDVISTTEISGVNIVGSSDAIGSTKVADVTSTSIPDSVIRTSEAKDFNNSGVGYVITKSSSIIGVSTMGIVVDTTQAIDAKSSLEVDDVISSTEMPKIDIISTSQAINNMSKSDTGDVISTTEASGVNIIGSVDVTSSTDVADILSVSDDDVITNSVETSGINNSIATSGVNTFAQAAGAVSSPKIDNIARTSEGGGIISTAKVNSFGTSGLSDDITEALGSISKSIAWCYNLEHN